MSSSDLRYLLNTNSGSFVRSRSQLVPSSTPLPPFPSSLHRSPTLSSPEPRKTRPLGFRNLGNTCYQNSVYQSLLALEPFTEALRGSIGPAGPGSLSLASRLEELQREREDATLPGVIQDGRRVREVLKHRMWRGREQQDALEFYLALVDQLHDEIKIGNFRGSLVTRTRCGRCSTDSTQKDAFFVVPLPLDGATSLEEALRQFQAEELLTGADSYACERCKRKTEATKSVEFQELPEFLVFGLKRFRWTNQGRCEKNGKLMKFPINNLIVPCTGNSLGKKYDLIATVHHKGVSTDSGHYTAHVKRDAKWYLCDDAHVAEVAADPANLVTSDTYLLFYQVASGGTGRTGLAGPSKSLLLPHTYHRQFSFFCVLHLLQCTT